MYAQSIQVPSTDALASPQAQLSEHVNADVVDVDAVTEVDANAQPAATVKA
jgi:hypothetical protein